jgi:hypothetical protein
MNYDLETKLQKNYNDITLVRELEIAENGPDVKTEMKDVQNAPSSINRKIIGPKAQENKGKQFDLSE